MDDTGLAYVRCADESLVLVDHVSGYILEMSTPVHGIRIHSSFNNDMKSLCKYRIKIGGSRFFCSLCKRWIRKTDASLRCVSNWQLCQHRRDDENGRT